MLTGVILFRKHWLLLFAAYWSMKLFEARVSIWQVPDTKNHQRGGVNKVHNREAVSQVGGGIQLDRGHSIILTVEMDVT